MNTKSVVINFFIRFFTTLNKYFEYSLFYKIFAAIGNAAKTSAFIQFFNNTFCKKEQKDYFEGSVILRLCAAVAAFIMHGLKKVYDFLANINSKSINKEIFDTFNLPLKKLETTISSVFCCFFGIFLVLFLAGVIGSKSIIYLGLTSFTCIFSLIAGFLVPQFFTKAFLGCAPVRIIKWFFNEN